MGKKDRSSANQPSHSGVIAYRTKDGTREVLLVTASGSGRWVIPKGHIVEEVGSRESARREAFEEAGIEGEVETTPFQRYSHGEDEALVEVFLMRVASEAASWPEEKVRERRWVPFAQTDDFVDDPGLRRLLRKAGRNAGRTSRSWRQRGSKRGMTAGLIAAALLIAVVLVAWTSRWRESGAATAIESGSATKGKKSAVAATDAACKVDGATVRLPDDLPEASGIAASRTHAGLLWTHNDAGDPYIYAVDHQGRSKARIRVTGAQAMDWESLDLGPCPSGQCLYIGDIGDNNASRSEIVVYRVAEPSPGDAETARAEALRARYPDGPADAEALFVTPDGRIYIVTKGETGPAMLYRFPTPPQSGVTTLERVRALADGKPTKNDRITGADVSADGRWIVLRSARNLAFYRATEFSQPSAPVAEMSLKALKEPQGEGISFGATSGTVFLIGEGGKKGNPGTLAALSCALD